MTVMAEKACSEIIVNGINLKKIPAFYKMHNYFYSKH